MDKIELPVLFKDRHREYAVGINMAKVHEDDPTIKVVICVLSKSKTVTTEISRMEVLTFFKFSIEDDNTTNQMSDFIDSVKEFYQCPVLLEKDGKITVNY